MFDQTEHQAPDRDSAGQRQLLKGRDEPTGQAWVPLLTFDTRALISRSSATTWSNFDTPGERAP